MVERARGHLHIVLAHGIDDLGRGQVLGRRAFGIDPDPHRVGTFGKNAELADPFQTRKTIDHLGTRIIREIGAVARSVRRIQVQHHQHVGRILGDIHPEPPHVLGQPRHRDRDPVLHQHLRMIEISAYFKGHVDR